MTQGFTQNLPTPLPVTRGGTGVITSTGSGANVLGTSPALTTPVITGITSGVAASAGIVGEIISSLNVSVTSAATNVIQNTTSIVLTPGQWICNGVCLLNNTSTSVTFFTGGINDVSVTIPDGAVNPGGFYFAGVGTQSFKGTPTTFFNVSVSTTIYLVARLIYTGSTSTITGSLWAVRIR